MSSPAAPAFHSRLGLPFAHLNLRRNPFGEVPTEERADLAVVDIEPLVPALRAGRFAVQFLGDKGFGKTTHLLTLRARLPGAPYLHVGEGERPELSELPAGAPLFLDELQRVPRRVRRALFARGHGLALGTHGDYTAELRHAGFEVVTVRPDARLDRQRLAAILAKRIEWARRGLGPVPGIRVETLDELLARCGKDVRAMESVLYERFQALERVCDV